MNEKIYYLKDQTIDNRAEWIAGLNQSGYAGILKGSGMIVDRREFPDDTIPIQQNGMFGVVKPKVLEEEDC